MEAGPSRNFRSSDDSGVTPGKLAGGAGRQPRDVYGLEASVTDGDDDQAAAQDGQASDDDSEEASGNAIKVTHDTALGSKPDGADQLIKTFGILGRHGFLLHGGALRASRRVWPSCAPGANCRTRSV